MGMVQPTSAHTPWEAQGGWAGLVAQQLREADDVVVPLDMSRLLLTAAARYIVRPGWKRGDLALRPGAPTSTLGAIHFAALPFGWAFPEHIERVRAASLALHRYLSFKGSQHKNPIVTIAGWDMAPERTAAEVYDLLEGAASGQKRCRRGRALQGSVGFGECWSPVDGRSRALCPDHRREMATGWFAPSAG